MWTVYADLLCKHASLILASGLSKDDLTHVSNPTFVAYAAGVQQLAGSLQQQLAETRQLLAGVVAELAQAKQQISALQHGKE
jgi:hypothetical protein